MKGTPIGEKKNFNLVKTSELYYPGATIMRRVRRMNDASYRISWEHYSSFSGKTARQIPLTVT